eukprot:TRINITY_DN472_c0_g14_i1.p1 TRINITY_DN472_c0_g14~~TRINITY_DN472_c0_g14_i1.p1  ORF type:complete len:382 (+),score=42.19 TRINITY_DN472_c0_g14_i1:271-1416(+)
MAASSMTFLTTLTDHVSSHTWVSTPPYSVASTSLKQPVLCLKSFLNRPSSGNWKQTILSHSFSSSKDNFRPHNATCPSSCNCGCDRRQPGVISSSLRSRYWAICNVAVDRDVVPAGSLLEVEEEAVLAPGIVAECGTKIEEVAPGVWTFRQVLGFPALGLDGGLRMTAIRLADGGVWLTAPVKMTPTIKDTLERLGPVRHIVLGSNSPEHWVFTRAYAKAYPEARIYTLPPLKRFNFVTRFWVPCIDETLTNVPPPEWDEAFDQVLFDLGKRAMFSEMLFLHKASGTLMAYDGFFFIKSEDTRFELNRTLNKRLGVHEQLGGAIPQLFATLRGEEEVREYAELREALLGWAYDTLILAHVSSPIRGAKAEMRKALATGEAP